MIDSVVHWIRELPRPTTARIINFLLAPSLVYATIFFLFSYEKNWIKGLERLINLQFLVFHPEVKLSLEELGPLEYLAIGMSFATWLVTWWVIFATFQKRKTEKKVGELISVLRKVRGLTVAEKREAEFWSNPKRLRKWQDGPTLYASFSLYMQSSMFEFFLQILAMAILFPLLLVCALSPILFVFFWIVMIDNFFGFIGREFLRSIFLMVAWMAVCAILFVAYKGHDMAGEQILVPNIDDLL